MKDTEARNRLDALTKVVEKLRDQVNYPHAYSSRIFREVEDVKYEVSHMSRDLQALLNYLGLEIVTGELVVRTKKEGSNEKS